MQRRLLHVTAAVPLRLLCQARRSFQSRLLLARLLWVMHDRPLLQVLRVLMRLLLMLLSTMQVLRRGVRTRDGWWHSMVRHYCSSCPMRCV